MMALVRLAKTVLKLQKPVKPYVRNICMAFDLLLKRKAPETKLFSMTI
jgi:oxygen-independent coproporphyrinogen-3 oxidase